MKLIELARQIGLNPKWVAQTEGGEYHSPCPSCAGTDRFVIQPNKQAKNCIGAYFCRKCGTRGDAIQFCRDFLGIKDFKNAVDYSGGSVPIKLPNIFTPKKANPMLSVAINMPPTLWLQNAQELVHSAHLSLMNHSAIVTMLTNRGLPIDALAQYKIGLLLEDKKIPGAEWGMEQESLWFPKGIIIPTLESKHVVRLKIRRHDWHPVDSLPKYIAVSGSMGGLNIIGDRKRSIMLVVESELDAYALHYIIGDIALVIAIGGSAKNIDSFTDHLAKNKYLFICHDNDEAGGVTFLKWKKQYAHAIALPTPIGKDIGEAFQQGLDIRAWIVAAILPHIQRDVASKGKKWKPDEQVLIDWILEFFKGRSSYKRLEVEIALGPDSPRAQTGQLQAELRLMKKTIEFVL